MFGDTIFSFLFETLSGSMPDRKSHAHVPILRDPPMIPLCDGLNGGASWIQTRERPSFHPYEKIRSMGRFSGTMN